MCLIEIEYEVSTNLSESTYTLISAVSPLAVVEKIVGWFEIVGKIAPLSIHDDGLWPEYIGIRNGDVEVYFTLQWVDGKAGEISEIE